MTRVRASAMSLVFRVRVLESTRDLRGQVLKTHISGIGIVHNRQKPRASIYLTTIKTSRATALPADGCPPHCGLLSGPGPPPTGLPCTLGARAEPAPCGRASALVTGGPGPVSSSGPWGRSGHPPPWAAEGGVAVTPCSGGNSVPQIHAHPEPGNGTRFGSRVSADVIS